MILTVAIAWSTIAGNTPSDVVAVLAAVLLGAMIGAVAVHLGAGRRS